MPRNYSLPTVKTLFAEASACAWPGCGEPLVFRDRGRATVVAEIAHIRSASPAGPRHDPAWPGDVDGPANLLLLCGRHHRPVDRYEGVYTVPELEAWKAAQRAAATSGGTPVSDADLRPLARLDDEERRALAEVARLAQRVAGACSAARRDIDAVRGQAERRRLNAARRFLGAEFVADDGTRTPVGTDGFSLSRVELDQWDGVMREAWDARRPAVEQAVAALDEELAVLRMSAPGLAATCGQVTREAGSVAAGATGAGPDLTAGVLRLDASVSLLWRVATGDADPPA